MKKTQGRRKIAIKPIANQNTKHVTFNKCHLGLFKKASELCILTGAEVAVAIQSLKRQCLFTFDHPAPTPSLTGTSLENQMKKMNPAVTSSILCNRAMNTMLRSVENWSWRRR